MNELIGSAWLILVAVPVGCFSALVVKVWPSVANFIASFINLHSKLDYWDLSKKDEP